MTCFALVLIGYEEIDDIFEIGDQDFIQRKYDEYATLIENAHKYEKPDELGYYNNKYGNMSIKRLCIQGYQEKKITCVCHNFHVIHHETVLY